MRNLFICNYKLDKKYLYIAIFTVLCAIICGIVLCKLLNISVYFTSFAKNYIYFVFNFKNGSLIFPHFLSDFLFLFLIFIISNYSKLKYLSLVLIFLKTLYFSIYLLVLLSFKSLGGVSVCIFVFVPVAIFSLISYFLESDICRCINKKFAIFLPLALCIINSLVLILFVNVVFRAFIVIV